MNSYEIGYLLSPLIPVETVVATVERLVKTTMVKAGGIQTGVEVAPKMTALAYPIKKLIENKNQTFREAYFGSVCFKAPPEAVLSLAESWQGVNELIRFLIINLPPVEVVPVSASAPTPVLGPTSATEVKAVIDKEIDGLLN